MFPPQQAGSGGDAGLGGSTLGGMMPGGGFSAGHSAGHGEQINHFAGVTMRVTGHGNLIPTWITQEWGVDGQPQVGKTKQMAPVVLPQPAGRQPFRLGSFVAQRASLELKVTQIDETFRINRIVVWVKPLWTGFPG
jgi:hypothetical protein